MITTSWAVVIIVVALATVAVAGVAGLLVVYFTGLVGTIKVVSRRQP